MSNTVTPLGIKIRTLREKHSLTLKDLAYSVGMSPQYLSDIEVGRRNATDKFILAVCNRWKLPKKQLLEWQKLAKLQVQIVRIKTKGLTLHQIALLSDIEESIGKLDSDKIMAIKQILLN